MMKRFEAVIFDMDGVIFDSELLVIKCWQVVADKYGIKNIEDTCHKCLGLKMVYNELTGDYMLEVTDWAEPDEKEDVKELWDSEIEKLKRVSGL